MVEVSVPEALRMPEVETLFTRHRHTYWPKLQRGARAWLLKKRLMPEDKIAVYADALRYTDLVAGYYVGAPDDVVAAIADFSTWFFIWDDRHDRDAVHGRTAAWRALAECLHAALDDPEPHQRHGDPLVMAFAECVVRMCSRLSPAWNARFARHFHAVIEAYDEEFANRRTGRVPTVDEYTELRRHTFAHHVWLDLLELAADHELPESVRTHPEYRRAGLASQDFSAWYNDLCSLPKEIAGDEVHNLGICLIQHEGISLEEAVAEVHGRAASRITEFLEAESALLRTAEEWEEREEREGGTGEKGALSGALRRCLFNMRNWFSSVYWFHHESDRYRVDTWADRSTPPYVSDPAGEA